MTTETRERTQYTMGYSDTFMKLLYRRTAEKNSAHLLPLLRPGMKVLDLGCGPGQISMGLARAVGPDGVVHGVDFNPQQVDLAYQNSNRQGTHNVVFTQEDACKLDLLSDTFDAVHCHAFLMHTPKIGQILSEAYRVLKPGGIMSAREMDVSTSYIAPSKTGETFWDMLSEVMVNAGGNPNMARDIKNHLILGGFENVTFGATADIFETQDDVRFLDDFLSNWALSEEMKARASESRRFQNYHFERWADEVRHWANEPGAVGVFQFCHAIGYKPRHLNIPE